jgi:hypothetical protein
MGTSYLKLNPLSAENFYRQGKKPKGTFLFDRDQGAERCALKKLGTTQNSCNSSTTRYEQSWSWIAIGTQRIIARNSREIQRNWSKKLNFTMDEMNRRPIYIQKKQCWMN